MMLSEFLKKRAESAIARNPGGTLFQLDKNVYAMTIDEMQRRKSAFELFATVEIAGTEYAIGALATEVTDVVN